MIIKPLRVHRCCPSVRLSVAKMQKNVIFSKTKQFRAKVSIDDLWEVVHGFFKEPVIGSLKSKMAEIRHLENRHDIIFFCKRWSDLDKISQTGTEWHVDCGDVVEIEHRCRIPIWRTFGRIPWHVIPEPPAKLQGAATLANSMLWFQSYMSHCRVLPPSEFDGMSSQSHVSHCRVLPLGEFTVTIPEGAVTWRNQCHDHATLQGVRIPSAILIIVIRHIFSLLMQFRLWRAAALVSSPIHLLITTLNTTWLRFL